MCLADAKSSKENCAKCSGALHSNTVPVRCSAYNNGFHQKCSTCPKASNCDDQWKRDTGIKVRQNQIAAFNVCQLPGSTNSTPSHSQLAASPDK